MKIEEAFMHLVERKQYKWKASTYSKYQYLYKKYIETYFLNINIEEIDDQLIQYYFDSLDLSNNTKIILRNLINQILEPYDHKIHYCIRKVHKEIVVLSEEEQNRLITYLYSLPYSPLNLGILICLFTGMRLGEICVLKWDDINMEEQSILVNKTVERLPCDNDGEVYKTKLKVTEPKSITSNRKVPIPTRFISYILTLDNRQDYLLNNGKNPYDPRSYEYYFAKLLKRAKIRKVNFHALRHTFATRCIEKGIDVKTVSEILGHSDISITIKYYVKSSFEFKKKQIEKLIEDVFTK